MMRRIRRSSVVAVFLTCAVVLSTLPVRAVETLPARLSDKQFWDLVSNFSEPDGFFHSDNYVSNERSFQQVLTELAAGRQPGSAYIGVGPEQNFTYLLAVKPKIAFIVDIRRQNMIEHLMYKALFEISSDRADFLSRLFARSRPPNLGRNSTVEELFDAFARTPVDPQIFQENLKAIRKHLMEDHGFGLSNADEANLEKVVRAFGAGGGNLTYDGPVPISGVRTSTGFMPTFADLMLETDREGKHRSFLATEDNFRTIQDFQKKNLLIPIVGNFTGQHALQSVGKYLRERDATVTSFYTSNVEQYLFMDGSWPRFYANLSTFPVNKNSVIVRGVIRSPSGVLSPSPALPPTSRYETLLFSIPDLVKGFNGGEIVSYEDIVKDR
jgi:hypothetical protein